MAVSNPDPHNLYGSFKAAANLSEKQFFLVKLSSEAELEVATEGAAAYVLTDTPEEGDYGTVVLGSEVQKVKLGGTVAVGDNLMSNGSGEAIKATHPETGTHYIVGIALEAGASGDIVTALTATPVAAA